MKAANITVSHHVGGILQLKIFILEIVSSWLVKRFHLMYFWMQMTKKKIVYVPFVANNFAFSGMK